MPIGGADGIGWDESAPATTEGVALGPGRIISTKTSIRQVLDSEHAFPSAGGNSVGYHRFGSARAYYGPQSTVSSSGTDGRLMVTSDTSRLFHVGSTGTAFLGGSNVISAGSYPSTAPQRAIWVEEFGAGVTGSGGSTSVAIPNSGYSGQPFVFVSGYTTVTGAGRYPAWGLNDLTATSFTVWAWDHTFSLSQGSIPFFWRSIGTRVL